MNNGKNAHAPGKMVAEKIHFGEAINSESNFIANLTFRMQCVQFSILAEVYNLSITREFERLEENEANH